jgi:UDP-glucose 4-epimerase
LKHRLYRALDERDGAEGLKLALEHDFYKFEIFNISSGSPFKEQDVMELKCNAPKLIAEYYPEVVGIAVETNF